MQRSTTAKVLLAAMLGLGLEAGRAGDPPADAKKAGTPSPAKTSPEPGKKAPGGQRLLEESPKNADAAALTLPPLPQGVEHLKFKEIFKPIGRRGLEHSDRLRSLDGKRVRMLGYMVRQSDPKPGMFLLSPLPMTLHEHEYGLCEDLPATTIHVFLPPAERAKIAPLTPGLLLLTGTLNIGNREEADGRISTVRLTLEAPPAAPVRAPSPPAASSPSEADSQKRYGTQNKERKE